MPAALLALALLATDPEPPREAPPEEKPAAKTLQFDWNLIPIVDYSSDFGVGAGGFGAVHWAYPGRPLYAYSIQAQLYANTGGQQYYAAKIDAPSLFDSPYRVILNFAYDRSRFAPWYGIGNHPLPDPSKGASYYQFDRIAPNGFVQVRRTITDWLSVLAQYQFTWAHIGVYPGSLLQGGAPLGISGGRYAEAFLGLIADTRDNEIAPNHGEFAELDLRAAHPVLGSQYATLGAYAAVSVFRQPWERLVLAGRLAFEPAWGDVPFDHLQDIGVSNPQQGLGGATTIRGLLQSEYVGDTKLLLNLEARVHLVEFEVLGQKLRLGVLGFLDAGRVWSRGVADPPGINIQWGIGGGIRLMWGHFFVIRIDAGFFPGQSPRFYADQGQIF